MPLAEARRVFDTNFFGLSRLTQLVIPGMRGRGNGRIINLSSVFGRFAVPDNAYYAASKHAVAALTDALRLELAAFGIRVILIEPTAARTGLNRPRYPVGTLAHGLFALRRWLPAPAFDRFLRTQSPRPPASGAPGGRGCAGQQPKEHGNI